MFDDLQASLDDFDIHNRMGALQKLVALNPDTLAVKAGQYVNMHCHTFFSYNAYGYSPSRFAWLARSRGLAAAQIVDFDVLDGLDEFIEAGRLLELKVAVGMETRVFVPEFADKEMTSPGEPGITYHMGVGFVSCDLKKGQKSFLNMLRSTAQRRNIELVSRVNQYLRPVVLDYERDVVPLTPSGNATERHICLAYVKKAVEVFNSSDDLARFWSEKLSVESDELDLPDGPRLQGIIRTKTMKQGGVGYVQPDTGSFPRMAQTNEFILAAGAIPALTWLSGFSQGEKAIERLLDVAMDSGVAAINIIPDRNFTPGIKDEKLANLYHIVNIAQSRNLPVVVGTEMNSPGQKFVDDFDSEELAPLLPVFLKGAYIVYGHSVMQRRCGLGYISRWAQSRFSCSAEKNSFFEEIGAVLEPKAEHLLDGLDETATPNQILKKIRR
ncbi:MAG: hypothetical protein ABIG61_02125 [Planctomycetota bacterium]